MKRAILISTILMIGFSAAIPEHADAGRRMFIWSYEPIKYPKGHGELEFYHQMAFYKKGNGLQGREFYDSILQTEYEYSPFRSWNMGFYSVFRKKSTGDFVWRGMKLKNIFNVLDASRDPIGLAFYVEQAFYFNQLSIEPKILIGKIINGFHITSNLIFEYEAKWHTFVHQFKFKLNLAGGYEIDPHLFLGVELGLPLRWSIEGRGNDWVADKARLYIGPTINIQTDSGMWFNFNLSTEVTGKFKNDKANLFESKLIVAIPFGESH